MTEYERTLLGAGCEDVAAAVTGGGGSVPGKIQEREETLQGPPRKIRPAPTQLLLSRGAAGADSTGTTPLRRTRFPGGN
jgi:hypothetical protein